MTADERTGGREIRSSYVLESNYSLRGYFLAPPKQQKRIVLQGEKTEFGAIYGRAELREDTLRMDKQTWNLNQYIRCWAKANDFREDFYGSVAMLKCIDCTKSA